MAIVIVMCCFWFCSHLSAVMNATVHISQPASSVIHQQLFRLIAINNRMNKSRLRDDNWNEGKGRFTCSCRSFYVVTFSL